MSDTVVAEVQPGRQATLASDAWRELRRQPLFLVALGALVVLSAMALVPGLFANPDLAKQASCDLMNQYLPPSRAHWFGTDKQGCDVYTFVIYGARASITVGITVTLLATTLGAAVGMVAGYCGGWPDALLSRVVDVFFGLPLLLGGLVFLSVLRLQGVWGVVLALSILGWTGAARIMRSSVIETRGKEYVTAARALGARNRRIIRRHILPNSLTAMLVVAAINLGAYIASEATFSYLGIGVQPPAISWGVMISAAQDNFQRAPWTLFFPSLFLSITVLAFILLGDSVREALDPRRR